MQLVGPRQVEITHFTFCCGLGGITLGLNRASAAVKATKLGALNAHMRSLGGIDCDPAAIRDFNRLTGGRGTVMDLFDRDDFRKFHGQCVSARKRCKVCNNTGEPPEGWREATPADILAAAGGECPDIMAWSPPCKGFSGLNAGSKAKRPRYQALNALVLRTLVLAMEAFKSDLPALMVMENVPLIATKKGRWLLEAIRGILESHGYAVVETVHDCGELGGLGQRRKRFLMVARLVSKVPNFLYEPPRQAHRSIGEVIGELPLPGDPDAGPMHRVPAITWKTWLRLALIQAGKDWRSLNDLRITDGYCADIGIVPVGARWQAGAYGVADWDKVAGTVTGASGASNNGLGAVADPRSTSSSGGAGKYRTTAWSEPAGSVIGASTTGHGAFTVGDPRAPRNLGSYEPYGVVGWDETSRTVTAKAAPGSGPYSVSDPRLDCDAGNRQTRRHCNVYRIVRWDETGGCVTSASGNSRPNVADPRIESMGQHSGKLEVQRWSDTARTVHGSVRVGSGNGVIQDPRPTWNKKATGSWAGSGHYGVLDPSEPSGTVVGNARYDKGSWSVADGRLPAPNQKFELPPLIIALDGTWHRPLTTMELMALQGFPTRDLMGAPIKLDGRNEGHWRMRIGNAVPPPAAAAFGSAMAHCLLLAFAEVPFSLNALPIWCRAFAAGLSAELPRQYVGAPMGLA